MLCSFRRNSRLVLIHLVFWLSVGSLTTKSPFQVANAQQTDQPPLSQTVAQSMRRAATYFHNSVSQHGGYVYYVSIELDRYWGEGEFSQDTIFVQPPGTPSVGQAYLSAFEHTNDNIYLEYAMDAGHALVKGQLESGGWTQAIHFAPPKKGRYGKYRNMPGCDWNTSSLDDDQTQSALRFLIRLDRALNFKDEKVHDAVSYGMQALLAAQFANGAFPQVWTKPVSDQPVCQANFPDYDWRTERRIKNYWDYYTLNDGLAGDVTQLLILAHETYKDPRYLEALKKLGNFLILAQMPHPQPAWCQQYNYDMQPMWARKFEPPAISGGESQDAMEALITIASYTGETKYLDPIPAAIDYFRHQCLLTNGRLARFYELGTNKPLYMDRDYELTYDDSDVPSHYAWTQTSRLAKIASFLASAKDGKEKATAKPNKLNSGLIASTQQVLEGLDQQGRWVTVYDGSRIVGQPSFPPGFQYLSSETFCKNIDILCRYMVASENER